MDSITLIRLIESNIEEALEFLMDQAKAELRRQGHYLTGNLERSFNYEIELIKEDCIEARIVQADYAIALDKGIPSANVPFSKPNGRGGRSQYIQALIEYFRKRGENSEDAKSYAFATAMKARYRTGHPTQPYFEGRSYSDSGRRTGWTERAYSEVNIREFGQILRFGELIEERLFKVVTRANAA